jgi:hypothetical protein
MWNLSRGRAGQVDENPTIRPSEMSCASHDFLEPDRFIFVASALHTGKWDPCERRKTSMRDWLEVIRQTLFGFS